MIDEKKCSKCNKELPVSEFYKREGGRLRSACKACTCIATGSWIEKNKEKHCLLVKRYYETNKERINKKAKERMKSPGAKRMHAKAVKKWIRKNKHKKRCQNNLNDALRYGKIEKGKCAVCGKNEVHGHHQDYTEPLDVIWLCPQHHKDIHSL